MKKKKQEHSLFLGKTKQKKTPLLNVSFKRIMYQYGGFPNISKIFDQ